MKRNKSFSPDRMDKTLYYVVKISDFLVMWRRSMNHLIPSVKTSALLGEPPKVILISLWTSL